MHGEIDKIVPELNELANEKESLLDISVGPIRNQLMHEIVLMRKSSKLLNELNTVKRAYEELLQIKWDYDPSKTTVEILKEGDLKCL